MTSLLAGITLLALAYALDTWLDERQAAAQASREATEWSRLTRTIRAAHRDFGGAR